jgi:capsular polysaccharide export protein
MKEKPQSEKEAIDILLQNYTTLEKRVLALEQVIQNEKIKNLYLKNRISTYQSMFDNYLFNTCFKDCTANRMTVDEIIKESKRPIIQYSENVLERFAPQLHIIFGKSIQSFKYRNEKMEFDLVCLWGLSSRYETSKLITEARSKNVPILFIEEGFIESIVPYNKTLVDEKFRKDHAIVIDQNGLYINARFESRLEKMINSLMINENEILRAKNVIRKIVENKISKYNHQPIIACNIGEAGRKKVLVIDQVWGDQSIIYGMANENTFEEMLNAAIKDNPNADIIVKTHPVTNDTLRKGHYTELISSNNIYKISYDINPFCLLEYVDKVYVCTSQMGFEALLCGKEVHVFGMPFYAGWGITIDHQVCRRRNRKRTLEEVFYMAYILYTKYVSYKTNTVCEIEEVIDDILELREEYWNCYCQ